MLRGEAILAVALALGTGALWAGDYPCWRNDGSGAGPDCGQPLVTDLKDAKWVWASEEKQMSSSYDLIEGGCAGPVYADGKVYAIWSFPSGPADEKLKAEREVFDKNAAAKGGKYGGHRKAVLESYGATEDELFNWMAATRKDDFLICMDAATGKTLWKTRYEAAAPNFGNRSMTGGLLSTNFGKPKCGPHNVPCVAYGKVAAIGIGGTLYCLDAASGKEVWHKQVAGAGSGEKPGPGSDKKQPDLCGASVLYGGGNFISQVGGGIAAFDAATGEAKWKTRAPLGLATQGGSRFTAGRRDVFMLGGSCVDAATGKELWTVEGSGGSGSPTIGEGYVVLGGAEKKLGLTAYKLNADVAKVPEKAWSLDAKYLSASKCSPVIYKGHVYTKMTADLPGGDCMFACVELASGKIVARIPSHTDACTSMVGGDGLVVYEGFAMNADPAKFALIPGSFPTGNVMACGDGSALWANSHTPCYAEGRMYIKGRNQIRCLDLRAKP